MLPTQEYQDAAQGEFEQRWSAGRWRLVIEDSSSDNVLEGRGEAPVVGEPQDLAPEERASGARRTAAT